MTTFRALTSGEVAREIGRTEQWLARNWRDEVRLRGMPAPIHERGGLVWSAPAIWAWLDKDLSPDLKPAAAAYRAALAAAIAAPADAVAADEIDAWRDVIKSRINRRSAA